MTRRKVVALPPQVANQIAAGEVVTRPASVVKELLENAIDAEARRITIAIEGGGITSLRVVDDGHGMDRDDAVLALERHATSKIRVAEDLIAIESFGFRGEALPSIASVSRVTIRTRPTDHDEGTEVVVEGGEAPRVSPCGCSPGTTVAVSDLFYNVPARRKFLRAISTEAAQVGEVVRALALAHPSVGFELIRDGRRSRRYLPAESALERARAVLEGYELVRCEGERGPARIEAYLSGAARARSGAGGLHLFVLGRSVQDRAIARAVASAYGDALEPGRFPVGAVFIDLPRELVDVNVHPQKAEVRFAHARAVVDAVHGVIRDAFGQAEPRAQPAAAWRPKSVEEAPWQWSEPTGGYQERRPGGGRPPSTGLPSPRGKQPDRDEPPTPALAPDTPVGLPSRDDGRLRLIGVARGSLLLCETSTGLAIVHRGRARASLLLRRAEQELAAGRLVSQRLLFPIVRSLDEAACDALEGQVEAAARLGIELRRVGPRSLAVHAVPRLFAGAPQEPLVSGLFAALGPSPGALEKLAELAAKGAGEDDASLVAALAAEELVGAVAARTLGWRELESDG